jgi:hypothetical protein
LIKNRIQSVDGVNSVPNARGLLQLFPATGAFNVGSRAMMRWCEP